MLTPTGETVAPLRHLIGVWNYGRPGCIRSIVWRFRFHLHSKSFHRPLHRQNQCCLSKFIVNAELGILGFRPGNCAAWL